MDSETLLRLEIPYEWFVVELLLAMREQLVIHKFAGTFPILIAMASFQRAHAHTFLYVQCPLSLGPNESTLRSTFSPLRSMKTKQICVCLCDWVCQQKSASRAVRMMTNGQQHRHTTHTHACESAATSRDWMTGQCCTMYFIDRTRTPSARIYNTI